MSNWAGLTGAIRSTCLRQVANRWWLFHEGSITADCDCLPFFFFLSLFVGHRSDRRDLDFFVQTKNAQKQMTDMIIYQIGSHNYSANSGFSNFATDHSSFHLLMLIGEFAEQFATFHRHWILIKSHFTSLAMVTIDATHELSPEFLVSVSR